MSYYEARSSILGGSPEPGLSSVIKVGLEFSEVLWKNHLSGRTCDRRHSIRKLARFKLLAVIDMVWFWPEFIITLAFFPQRLEDQHLNGDPGAKSPTVPTKIRDVVTKSISPVDSKMASPGFGDETRMLQSEVSRLEDLLAATRAERDEIGSKFMAVSDKVWKTVNCNTFVDFTEF